MVKFVCVYKTCEQGGKDFFPGYVEKLKAGLLRHGAGRFEFLCYTDHKDLLRDHSDCIPLLRPERKGWWALPEKFRTKGPVMFVGLDTVIVDSLEPFADIADKCEPNEVYTIKVFRIPNKWNRIHANGILIWNGNFEWMFDKYNYIDAESNYMLEQDYTMFSLIKRNINLKILQHYVDGIYSYKNHCLSGKPKNARIILFHGKPTVVTAAGSVNWIKESWHV